MARFVFPKRACLSLGVRLSQNAGQDRLALYYKDLVNSVFTAMVEDETIK